MARAGAGRGGECGWFMRSQSPFCRAERIDKGFIEAEIGDEEEAVGFVEIDAVGVRAILSFFVGA